jgi:FtsH-binding integral membrane protein
MTAVQQKRGWLWIAMVAIGIALVLVLALHAQSADHAEFAAILSLLFVGIISPLSLLSPLAFVYLGRTPDAPVVPATFQRPPPFGFA